MPAPLSTPRHAGLRPLLTVLPLLLAATACSAQAEARRTERRDRAHKRAGRAPSARIEPGALSAWVAPAEGGGAAGAAPGRGGRPGLGDEAGDRDRGALEQLGPVHAWRTPVLAAGPDRILRGSGDPRLTAERLALLLRQAMDAGGATIDGDLILRIAAPTPCPAMIRRLRRPAAATWYNVGPDALMVAHRSVVLTLRPDPARGVARIAVDLPLAGVQWPGPCR